MPSKHDRLVANPTPLMRLFGFKTQEKARDRSSDSPGWKAYEDYLRNKVNKEKEGSHSDEHRQLSKA